VTRNFSGRATASRQRPSVPPSVHRRTTQAEDRRQGLRADAFLSCTQHSARRRCPARAITRRPQLREPPHRTSSSWAGRGGEYDGDLSDKAVLTASRLAEHPAPPRRAGGGPRPDDRGAEPASRRRRGIWGPPEQAAALKPGGRGRSPPRRRWLRALVRGPVRIQVTTEVETGWQRISFRSAIPGVTTFV
jgi:hypothetical protein